MPNKSGKRKAFRTMTKIKRKYLVGIYLKIILKEILLMKIYFIKNMGFNREDKRQGKQW